MVLKTLIAASTALLAFSSPAAAARKSTVPFELRYGHIFVQAYVNGKGPYLFGFDTGASGMGRADVRLVGDLSLPKVGVAENSDGIKAVAIDIVAADSLRLGALEKRHVQLLSRDYNGSSPKPPFLMGFIGRDFFADRLVTIDYPHRTLTFSGGALKPGGKGVVPYGPSFSIPICFASGCYQAKVDTGLSGGIVVPKAVAVRLAAGPASAAGSARRANTVSTLYEIELKEAVRIGKITAIDQTVLYTDPSDDVAAVGSDFLKDYVLTIDQRHKLLRIIRPRD